MIRVHTKDGKTVAVNLRDERQASALLAWLASDRYQQNITALTVSGTHRCSTRCPECGARAGASSTSQTSISMPKAGGQFDVKYVGPNGGVHGGERLILYTGDTQLVLMSHANQAAFRVSLTRLGKRVADPTGLTRGRSGLNRVG